MDRGSPENQDRQAPRASRVSVATLGSQASRVRGACLVTQGNLEQACLDHVVQKVIRETVSQGNQETEVWLGSQVEGEVLSLSQGLMGTKATKAKRVTKALLALMEIKERRVPWDRLEPVGQSDRRGTLESPVPMEKWVVMVMTDGMGPRVLKETGACRVRREIRVTQESLVCQETLVKWEKRDSVASQDVWAPQAWMVKRGTQGPLGILGSRVSTGCLDGRGTKEMEA
ncbi:hypothetical protein ANANG_G00145040 [Anguilla anguilla]|uniref:Uncharacterized protein n=1 Tax=Anguilla anguilla TaxID=7936 RepID=A0A9D3MCE9_ANGAN|nr:hypothetical protein ANANG_G00145040 [Anguilla anguilla]